MGLAIGQIPSCLSYIYDGILFGLGAFAYMRNFMLIGLVCIFLPISSVIWWDPQLIWIWWGLIGLNTWRLVCGIVFRPRLDACRVKQLSRACLKKFS